MGWHTILAHLFFHQSIIIQWLVRHATLIYQSVSPSAWQAAQLRAPQSIGRSIDQLIGGSTRKMMHCSITNLLFTAQLAKTLGVSRLIVVINKLDCPSVALPGEGGFRNGSVANLYTVYCLSALPLVTTCRKAGPGVALPGGDCFRNGFPTVVTEL